jgi:hypothetical protein
MKNGFVTRPFSLSTLNPMSMEDSHKKFAIEQQMDVDICSAWIKLG